MSNKAPSKPSSPPPSPPAPSRPPATGAGWPSTTGNPSGGGRQNAPPKK